MTKMGASPAQAKLLARVWGTDAKLPSANAGFISPTTKACIDREWLRPTEITGTYPNGTTFRYFIVSQDGLRALATFLEKEVGE